VFLKNVQFDADGHPVLLYLTSTSANPGDTTANHFWHTARWDGRAWQIREIGRSDHNYDFGSLYVEPDGTWRLIAPLADGPIPCGTGGGMQMRVSTDQGTTWTILHDLAKGVGTSHTYARRPHLAHDDFYAFWADGDPFTVSESSIYFTNRLGTAVWRLPYNGITSELVSPERVWTARPSVAVTTRKATDVRRQSPVLDPV
jgi:hypothetical protein